MNASTLAASAAAVAHTASAHTGCAGRRQDPPERAYPLVGALVVVLGALLSPAFASADLAFTSKPPLQAAVNQPYVYTMTADDDEHDDDGRRRGRSARQRFVAQGLPGWLEFDGHDTIAGTPDANDVGIHPVRLLVRRRGDLAVQAFMVTVRPAPSTEPPPATPPPPPPEPREPPERPPPPEPPREPPAAPPEPPRAPPEAPPPAPPASRPTTDLEAFLSVSPNPALIEAAHAWTLRVSNLGEADVANLELSAVFAGPDAYRIENISDAGCAASRSAEITCRWSALAAGATRTVTLQSHASAPGEIHVTATVSILDPSPVDRNRSNDRAMTTLSVTDTPTVQPIQTLAVHGTRGLAVGDFDRDGRDDLAVAANDAVFVFMNSPDDHGRPFGAPPLEIPAAAGGTAVAAGDLDGDGNTDLVIARPNAASIVLFGLGAEGFETMTFEGADARAVAIGDVDGDSLIDIAFAGDGGTAVHRNLGGRRFDAAESVGTGATVAAAADFTGEAAAELVLAGDSGKVEIYRRDSSGYVLVASPSSEPASALAIADVDADSLPDLAIGSRSAASRVLLAENGTPLSFATAASLSESATADVLLADFDMDGATDVATIGVNGVHRIHRNGGVAPPAFASAPHRFTGTHDPVDAGAGFFDYDDVPDVAVAADDGVEIFLNVGRPLPAGAPRLVLNGETTVILTVGDEYVDAGARAFDDTDGNLTSKIVVTNPVDAKTIGSYVVTYEVADSAGNVTRATRTVEVQARAAAGGGGGAIGLGMLALLIAAAGLRREKHLRTRRRSRDESRAPASAGTPGFRTSPAPLFRPLH